MSKDAIMMGHHFFWRHVMAIQVYPSHIKAKNNLTALEGLKQTGAENKWNQYRLLPTTPMYLVASRYCAQERVGWSLTSKWDMFNFFDNALKNCVNPQSLGKINTAIDGAIIDQRKIFVLKATRSVLLDSSKTPTDKTNAYLSIRDSDPAFFENIKNAIWVAHGASPNAGLNFADTKIEKEPAAPLQLAVLKKMASTIKAGYTDYNPGFYKDLRV
jgi:hypothetical protein